MADGERELRADPGGLSLFADRLHPDALADVQRWAGDPELGKLRGALHAHSDESVFFDAYAEALVARYLLASGCELKFEVPTPTGKHCDFEVTRGGQTFYLHVKRMQTEPPEPRHVTISPRLRYLERIPRPYLVRVRWDEALGDASMQRFVARAAEFISHARVGDELTVRDDEADGRELGGVQIVAPWSGSSVSLLIGLPEDFVDEAPRIQKLLNRAYQQFMPQAMNMIVVCSMSRDDVGDFQNALLGSHIERWDATPKPGQRIAHGRAADGFWHGGRFAESVVAGWFSFAAADRDIHVRLWQRQGVVIDPPMQALLGELFG